MIDMNPTIIAKSDQLNADDLMGGAITIKIVKVAVSDAKDQPISIFYDGNDKPWKPCKSMRRVLVAVWGADGQNYVGKHLTIFRDSSVKWAGEEVGGIRISHMSGIDAPVSMSLTATRGKKAPWTVQPLQIEEEIKPPMPDEEYKSWKTKMDDAETEQNIKAIGVEIANIAPNYDRDSIGGLKTHYKNRLETIKSSEAPF